MAWRAAAGSVLVLVLVVGCGSDPAAPPTSTSAATTVTADEVAAIEAPEVQDMAKVPAAPAGTQLRLPVQADVDPAFLRGVFADTQQMWQREFAAVGVAYEDASLTFFGREGVVSGCAAQRIPTGIGPFYCTADRGVYLDVPFFHALGHQFGVVGQFAQAYVIGHELGHHVQSELRVIQRVKAIDARDPQGANARSIRIELQADCYAGIWLRTAFDRTLLSEHDIADALHAAAVIGDDFQQRLASGRIEPERWTHGTSQQRQRWLQRGIDEGRPAACDTFSAVRP